MQFASGGSVETLVDDFFGKYAEFAVFKGKVDPKKPRRLIGVPFHLVFGDPSTAAIYQAFDLIVKPSVAFRTEDILPAFTNSEFNFYALLSHLAEADISRQGTLAEHICSLKVVATITALYEHSPGATIATTIVKNSLARAKWFPQADFDIETKSKAMETISINDQRKTQGM